MTTSHLPVVAGANPASVATRPLLSVVMPVHNEADTIPNLHRRLTAMADAVAANDAVDCEFIFVDDGSRDASYVALKAAAAGDPRVKLVKLSRNFGHQIALTAGLDHARGDAVVAMDSDLQDPPEVIPRFLAKWREGFDVVYGKRSSRAGESTFKRLTATIYYRLLRRLTAVDIPVDAGDFRLMSRRAADALKGMREQHRYVRGMVSWVGFNQTAVEYDREPRQAGQTSYTLRRMVKLSKDGVTSFSMFPLKLAAYIGGFALLCAFAALVWTLWLKFVAQTAVPGWASLMVIVLFLLSMQFIILGILGEYLGRIYDEVRQRPLYLVSESVGFSAPAPTAPATARQ